MSSLTIHSFAIIIELYEHNYNRNFWYFTRSDPTAWNSLPNCLYFHCLLERLISTSARA
jgi:hypothetical protein